MDYPRAEHGRGAGANRRKEKAPRGRGFNQAEEEKGLSKALANDWKAWRPPTPLFGAVGASASAWAAQPGIHGPIIR